MSVRNIDWPADQEAVLRHIRLVHGQTDHDVFSAWYGKTPWFDPADVFVIDGQSPGEIAAHAMIMPRHLQIGESLLPTAEIGLIGVMDNYRGMFQALLEAVHARMTARGDALGLIFGVPDFYERWQYEYAVGLYLTSFESEISTDLAVRAGRWNLEHSYERRTADRLGTRNQTATVRRFEIDDLAAVQALYDAACACGHMMIARDETIWNWQLDYLTSIGFNEPDDFLVAEVDNQLVAYARFVTQDSINWFREGEAARFSIVEAAGDHPDAIEGLLGEIAQTARAYNTSRIGLFVHPESTFMRHALARGATQRDFTGAGFLRLHNLPLTLDLLQPTLETRCLNSRYAGRGYRLMITTEHDQADVHLGQGEGETVELEAPSTTLVRLITGWYGIDHLSTGYHERYADLLRILFPRRDPKIGLADML